MNYQDLKNKKIINFEEIQLNKYIPLIDKMAIIDAIKDNMIDIEDGFATINIYNKELYMTFAISKYYGGIEYAEDENGIFVYGEDEYNFLQENGVIQFIEDNVNDIWKFTQLLENALEQEIEKRNSLPSIVLKLGTQLISKLDEMSDPKKLKQLGKVMKDITDKNPMLLDLLKDANLKGVIK